VRLLFTLLLLTASFALAACAASSDSGQAPGGDARTASTGENAVPSTAARQAAADGAEMQKASLSQAEASQAAPVPVARKIIRNASVTVEVEVPADAQRKLASVAEQRGGFVVTSESKRHGGSTSNAPAYEVVSMEMRVPSEHFDAVINEIRGVGGTVVEEKITGQDVTEEYIDLEARIRTQRALEAQLLELLKRAESVQEALGVQREIANVRTVIESVEGRRRFLESQSSLSTIKVTLRPSALLSSAGTSGFFYGLKRAISNGLEVASDITVGLVTFFVALIPVLLLLVLPAVLIARSVLRRVRRRAPPAPEPQLK
jgi:hypothetical protein